MNYFEEIMNETVLSWNGQRLEIVDDLLKICDNNLNL